jgi:two-component system NtrC family sensor kinase
VEVGYTEEKPPIDEGPFLLEERELIDTIARELAFVIEQKSHADEKEQLQAQLRHADRLATIGQLAAGVAHELNEPLATIMGFAQLAAKQAGIPDNAARDMNKIVTAALHARGIIKELLVFAREARPIKVMFNLNDLIRDGLFFLEARFVKAGISLLCELDENLPDMRADRSQMLQVLTNLIVNSVQAMPNGGRLTIKTAQHENHVQLVIIDTGCGMDENTVKNIFHPFFSTKDVDAGTGLGLSVVHGIVASHQGRIEVESRPGRGTRFCLTLPLNTAESTSES